MFIAGIKKNVVYTCSGILFSLKKEGNSNMLPTMNLEDVMLSEISPSQNGKYCMRFLEESNSGRK